MNKIRNDELLEALEGMHKEPTDERRMYFIYKLSTARLLVPVVISPEPVDGVIAKGSTMTFFSMEASSKMVYLATFTDYDELCKWNKNPNKQVVVYNFDTIYELITKRSEIYDGYVINPAGANIGVKRSLMEDIYNNMHPSVIVKPEKVATEGKAALTAVENPPEDMVKALVGYCEKNSSIISAYIMQTIRQGEHKPTFVIIVDFAGESPKRVFDGIALSLNDMLNEKSSIGMMPAYDKVAKEAIKGVKPIYRKK